MRLGTCLVLGILATVASCALGDEAGALGDGVGRLCVFSHDDHGERVPFTEAHPVYVSVVSSSRMEEPERCISSTALVNKLELEKISRSEWRVVGEFEKGTPPYTPDCGGGTAILTLGKLPASRYTIRSGSLELEFDVYRSENASQATSACSP